MLTHRGLAGQRRRGKVSRTQSNETAQQDCVTGCHEHTVRRLSITARCRRLAMAMINSIWLRIIHSFNVQ